MYKSAFTIIHFIVASWGETNLIWFGKAGEVLSNDKESSRYIAIRQGTEDPGPKQVINYYTEHPQTEF